jgi:hypothetical protein
MIISNLKRGLIFLKKFKIFNGSFKKYDTNGQGVENLRKIFLDVFH